MAHPSFPAAAPIALLALVVAPGLPAKAQTAETCLIGPEPPAFGEISGEDRLHPRPEDAAAAHTHPFHGQLILGEETIYWRHLPVFMGNPAAHPHNFQVILEVAFENPNDKARYREDRLNHPDVLYTVVPREFEQTALISDESGGARLDAFPRARVFSGHFEQGGEEILTADFAVERVVYFREFLLDGDRLERQSYILFGRGDDVFLAHLVSAPPDFDQILAVAVDTPDIPTETIRSLVADLVAGGLFVQLPDRANEEEARARAGETITCSLDTGTRALPVTVELRIGEEVYCEAGELEALVTANFNTPRRCAE